MLEEGHGAVGSEVGKEGEEQGRGFSPFADEMWFRVSEGDLPWEVRRRFFYYEKTGSGVVAIHRRGVVQGFPRYGGIALILFEERGWDVLS